MQKHVFLRTTAVGIFLACLGAPSAAEAQPVPAKLRPILSDLDSSDVGKVRHAIGMLEAERGPHAGKALIAFVKRGPPGPALVPAIRAIGGQKAPGTLEVLLALTRHRRPDARVAAAEGLSNHRVARAAQALERLLSDPSPDVRGAAASALATAGSRSNVEVLFRALEKDVDEAAVAIGKLGNAQDVLKLSEFLGRRPLESLLPAFEACLLRSNLAAQTRIEIVYRLGRLETAEMREFLERVQLAVPTTAVREAMLAEAGRIAQ